MSQAAVRAERLMSCRGRRRQAAKIDARAHTRSPESGTFLAARRLHELSETIAESRPATSESADHRRLPAVSFDSSGGVETDPTCDPRPVFRL